MPAPQRPRTVKQKEFAFRRGDDIGSVVAETDAFLERAFVDVGEAVRLLKDTANQRGIVVGRTGIGKSALLLHLERTLPRVQRVDPLGIAIGHAEANTVLPALVAAGVNLDTFFKHLWRRLLILEVLRAGTAATSDWASLTQRITAPVLRRLPAGRRRERILEELRADLGDDWQDTAAAAQRILDAFDRRVRDAAGPAAMGRILIPVAPEGIPPALDPELKRAVQDAVTRFSAQRVKEHYQFLSDEALQNRQNPVYVLVDRLDDAWPDSPFAYDLVDGLIEVAGEFAEVPNVKVIVALRDDLVAALRTQVRKKHRQWEKHENLFLRVRWSDAELVDVVNARLAVLRERYAGDIDFESLLPRPRPKHDIATTEWVLRRTTQRPRDVIAFVNRMLEAATAAGKRSISWEVLTRAEAVYSSERLEALRNEWQSNFGDLNAVFEEFRGVKNGFTVHDLASDRLYNLYAHGEIGCRSGTPDPTSLTVQVYQLLEAQQPDTAVWRVLCQVLYRVGFLGARRPGGHAVQYVFDEARPMDLSVSDDTVLWIHPAYCRALNTLPPTNLV